MCERTKRGPRNPPKLLTLKKRGVTYIEFGHIIRLNWCPVLYMLTLTSLT